VTTFLNAKAQRREDAKEDKKTARHCIQQIQFRTPFLTTVWTPVLECALVL
jgi:hypothetical protein